MIKFGKIFAFYIILISFSFILTDYWQHFHKLQSNSYAVKIFTFRVILRPIFMMYLIVTDQFFYVNCTILFKSYMVFKNLAAKIKHCL